MSPTLTRSRRPPSRELGGGLLVGAGVAAVIVIAVALLPAMRLPSYVSRITVANPTGYPVEIDVGTPARDGWLSLGGFGPGSTRNVYEVIDQGRQWVLRFTYGGREVGQVALRRSQLVQNRWRITVPAELGDRLTVAGNTPSIRG